MARAESNIEVSSFRKGLLTEVSQLTFPPDASVAEENFDILTDGTRRRRLGIDFENGFVEKGAGSVITNEAITSFEWKSVGGDPLVNILVLQIGDLLHFYDLSTTPITANTLNGGATINLASGSGGTQKFAYAQIGGDLIVVSDQENIKLLTTSNSGATITTTNLNLKVRDVWGVDDGLEVDERPATSSNSHLYNLKNQNWLTVDIDRVRTFQSVDPSNADIGWLAKKSDGEFSVTTLLQQAFGTTQAPQGKFVIEALLRGTARNALPGFSGLPLDQSLGGPITVESYAGRVFYAGFRGGVGIGQDSRSPNLVSMVFFSQVVTNATDADKCHSDNDPTSEHISDILDTDGGFFPITGARRILKLIEVGDSLAIIAENGIWQVKGNDGGFSATGFQIVKVADIEISNAETAVVTEDALFVWGAGGIFRLGQDPVTGTFQAVNLSEVTIQDFFTDIPELARNFAKGIYDPVAREVRWLYNDSVNFTGGFFYNKELVFNTVNNAFIPLTYSTLATDSPSIVGFFKGTGLNSIADIQTITSGGGVNVVTSGGGANSVISTTKIADRGNSSIQYIILTQVGAAQHKITVGLLRNGEFLDWESFDGVGLDAPGFIIGGFIVGGDTQRKKEINFLTTLFSRTETGFIDRGDGSFDARNPSSATVQAQWEWSNDPASNRFGTAFEAYRIPQLFLAAGAGDPFNTGFELITTRNKIRGRGRAISFKFSTKPKHDLHLVGYSMNIFGQSDT